MLNETNNQIKMKAEGKYHQGWEDGYKTGLRHAQQPQPTPNPKEWIEGEAYWILVENTVLLGKAMKDIGSFELLPVDVLGSFFDITETTDKFILVKATKGTPTIEDFK